MKTIAPVLPAFPVLSRNFAGDAIRAMEMTARDGFTIREQARLFSRMVEAA